MSNECIEVNSEQKTILNSDDAQTNTFDLFSDKEASIYSNTFLHPKNKLTILPSPLQNSVNDNNNKAYSKIIDKVKETSKRIAEDDYFKSLVNSGAEMTSKITITDDPCDYIKPTSSNEDIDKKPIMIAQNRKKIDIENTTIFFSITYKQPCISDFFRK